MKRRLLALLFILALAFTVRGLTMRFIRDHLTDPGWFQSGSYAILHRQAVNILDSKASIFWIDDPNQTAAAIYPPGYPLWLAVVYTISGERSAASAQTAQWIIDSLSVLLIVGIGVTGYSWATGLAAGTLAALSPLLALSGATPGADAPTNWIVLAGVWLLLLAYKSQRLGWALAAGIAAGASCWLRANALLLVIFWALAFLFLFRSDRRRGLLMGGAIVLGAAIMVAPLLIRNAIAFRAFVPTGLGMGTNLWEGLGETDRAAEFGAVYGDKELVEQERKALGVPAGVPFGLYFPDGVKRDRERTRKALSVIARHPLWYAGVMARRTMGMLKYAGKPTPAMGSAGINVTAEKSLPLARRGGILAFAVNLLGMVQSVFRWLAVPLILVGLWFAIRRDVLPTWVLLATVLYYLFSLSFMHSELRYGLPMHSLLLVWAGLATICLPAIVRGALANLKVKQD